MQFNPACLSSAAPPPAHTHTNVGVQGNEYLSPNLQVYPEAGVQNGWSNIITSLPFYGIYNPAGLIAIPTTPPQEVSPVNIPVVSPSLDASKKKVPPPKRPGQSELFPLEKLDDKPSVDEEQKLKRQRRLLKNREAAQQFRLRQKEYIQNLERKVTELNSHVGETHKHIELLTTENRLLRDQLVYLYNVMRQNLTLSPTSPTASSFPATVSPPPPPAPPATIDLGLLGFKGFSVLDNLSTGYEEMLKSTSPTMGHSPTTATPAPSPSITPAHSPSIAPSMTSPLTPRIPDLTTLSIAKGMELETSSSMFVAFGSAKEHEPSAQTVPELAIKAEGGGGNM